MNANNKDISLMAFVVTFSQVAMLGIVYTYISELQTIDTTGELSSYVSSVHLAGVSFAGLVFGQILRRYQGVAIGVASPLLSVMLVGLIFFVPHYLFVFGVIFLLAMISGLDSPNNSATLNALIPNQGEKAHIFAKVTMVSQIFVVATPLLVSFLVIHYGHAVSYGVLVAFYILTALPWLFLSKQKIPICKNSEQSHMMSGFILIWNIRALRDLTISRILNNWIFTGLIVTLPFVVSAMSDDNHEFTRIQNFAISCMSMGFIVNGFMSGVVLKKYPLVMTIFAQLASGLAFVAVAVVLMYPQSPIMVYMAMFILGVGQCFFRLSGMTLGQSVTPEKDLADVILAGDTLVRVLTLVYSLILIYLISWTNSYAALFIFSAVGVLAVFFVRKANAIYAKNCLIGE